MLGVSLSAGVGGLRSDARKGLRHTYLEDRVILTWIGDLAFVRKKKKEFTLTYIELVSGSNTKAFLQNQTDLSKAQESAYGLS